MNKIRIYLTTFIIFFITLFITSLVFANSARADVVYTGFGSNNRSNIIWQVGFRLISSGGTTHATILRLVDQTGIICIEQDGSCRSYNRTRQYQWGPCSVPGSPPYRVQWSTACIDPDPKAVQDYSGGGGAGCSSYGSWTTGAQNITATTSNSPFDQNSYSGGTIYFPGWGSGTSGCPRSCVTETCADRGYQCGSFTDGCGNVRNCGSCPGTQVCSSGRCEQNYGCTDNGACVEKQCQ
ncbi:MAG: hypothetical protein HYW63_04990, partial [Candidatus Levybacteria bacterium]|nr:hypothetical protein [Candidatus Levybacteria bacterium]